MTTLSSGLQTTSGSMIPLQGVEIVGEIYGGHGQVTIRQRYKNKEPKPVEAIYTFPLPADASLVGFAMVCDGRRLEGVVKEREDAFREYDEAVSAGHGAALLEQERSNVFTASVGNLLPDEETFIEVQYLQRLRASEGALRLMIPTLVAPRYIPGTPAGKRTGEGWAEPTDRVPDADRITPRIGTVDYGLTLDVLFDLGTDLTIESPSHAVSITDAGEKRVRVTFTNENEVALDRDVVLIARGALGSVLTAAVVHNAAKPAETILSEQQDNVSEAAVLALTVVPDLTASDELVKPQEVVFLIDISGSMMGASIAEARTALRLCLRHLREGDRFNIIAFQTTYQLFAQQLAPFTQKTLEQADAWVQTLVADGGTEMLEPVVEAVKQVPNGVIVLLTDGQVGNEDEILAQVIAQRGRTRVYPFGIGTNVSDALLRDLAKRTGGAVEFIYPGERIDEKVVAQFARAVAPRVTDVTLSFSGDFTVSDLAPSELPDLVDGEPWELFAALTGRGAGQAEIHGSYQNAPFVLTAPINTASGVSRPLLVKFWAAERIRDLEAVTVSNRRAERIKERILDLAVTHGLASRYTSFLVIEERTGLRRAPGQPETRVLPVNLPAGWGMFERRPSRVFHIGGAQSAASIQPAGGPLPASSVMTELKQPEVEPSRPRRKRLTRSQRQRLEYEAGAEESFASPGETPAFDPIVALLSRQLASGLWEQIPRKGKKQSRRLQATARALLELLRAGVTTAHVLHGGQVRKAVEAIINLAPTVAVHDVQIAEIALGAAWLVTDGARLKGKIEAVAARTSALATLAACFPNDQAVRAYIDQRIS